MNPNQSELTSIGIVAQRANHSLPRGARINCPFAAIWTVSTGDGTHFTRENSEIRCRRVYATSAFRGACETGGVARSDDEHSWQFDDTPDVVGFAQQLEFVCVETVERGSMTTDLALLIGPDQLWLTTQQFLDELDRNLHQRLS